MNKRWRPSVTVAAVIENEGRFLLVEEQTPEGLKLNNPAGHLEPGETPEAAVVREALEETAHEFVPEALLGVYMARFVRVRPPRAGRPGEAGGGPRPLEDVTYLRFAYSGRVGEPLPGRALDPAIVRTLWLTREEIAAEEAAGRLRSPLVMRCIDDHLAGRRLPLGAVSGDASLAEPLVLHALPPPALPQTHAGGGPAGQVGDRPGRPVRRRARKRMQDMDENNTEGRSLIEPGIAGAEGTEGAGPLAHDAPDAPHGAAASGESQTPWQPAPAGPEEAAGPTPEQSPGADATSKPSAEATPAAAGPARPEPTLAETAAALAERFPALFAPGQPRPIKLRIQADIQARTQGAFTRKQLSIFLHRHTTSTPYLRALVASPQRFDLDGQPAGDVAAEHVQAAKEELERRRQIAAQRRAQQGPRSGRAAPSNQAPAGAADGPTEGVGAGGAATTDRPPRPPRPARPESRGRPDRPGRPGGPDRGPRPPAAGQGDRPPRPERGDRPAGDRPPGRPAREPFDLASGRPSDRPGSRNGPPGGPRAERGDRGHDRSHDRGFPRRGEGDRAEATTALPQDPAHRERAMLLRSFEGSPLTAANYCALKGLALAEFEAQIALARREREERQRTGAGGS